MKVYKLVYNDQCIYVGSTTMSLERRFGCKYRNIPKEILKESQIVLIEEADSKTREDFWIEYFRSMGCELYNRIRAVLDEAESREKLNAYKKERWENDPVYREKKNANRRASRLKKKLSTKTTNN